MQKMLHKVVFTLALFTLLRPGTPQEDFVSTTLQSMNTLLSALVTKSNTQLREMYQLKAQMEEDLRSLREELSCIKDSVASLNDSLQEQNQRLDSVNRTIHSKLETTESSPQGVMECSLSQISSIFLTCTPQITGLVALCPANSCSQVLDLIHEGFLHSNYYWLQALDGNVTEVYCNRSTMQPEYSSCQQLFEFESVPSGTYTIRPLDGSPVTVYCNLETGQTAYDSCAHANFFGLPSGTYIIQPSGGSAVTVYCDMDNEECGGGVWTRVASYNYSDPSTMCPGEWSLISSPVKACGRRSSYSGSCSSASFSTSGVQFSSVCGRVIAVQYGSPDAFYRYYHQNQRSIDSLYVDGISITHGNPRHHVWTFAGYPSDDYAYYNLCPCSQPSLNIPSPPSFVGNNYFCDTGAPTCCGPEYYLDDPLWDGHGCGGPSTCCSFNNPPWFSAALPETTSDDIEVRICDGESTSFDNVFITLLDLYIQ